MNSQKFVIGGIVGGIVYFLLGWLTYGVLLKDYMESNMNKTGIMRADDAMIWWALIVGQLLMGFLMAYIIGKSGARTAGSGAMIGFVVGLLMCLAIDLTMYATTTIFADTKSIAIDVAISSVMGAIVGAVVAWVMGRGRPAI